MKLVIVESPTKARTLGRFLGKDYKIFATMGHIKDLPASKLGVEIKLKTPASPAGGQNSKLKNYNFIPDYITVPKKDEMVEELKKEVKTARQIILATDPDREGEAIAYHVAAISGNSKFQIPNSKFMRIVFHEITKGAIEEAIRNPRNIDKNLVEAQEARRILDRLVGYKLSPLLWRKIRRGLSAGRVQSVAVRLIVEREREIEKFKSEKYFRVWAGIKKLKVNRRTEDGDVLLAQLVKIGEREVEQTEKITLFAGDYRLTKTIFVSENQAEDTILDLGENLIVKSVEEKEVSRYPFAPFITSTLQQEASRRFGWSGKQTMRVAQALYEKGLITYHRTDSTNLSFQAIFAVRKLIEKEYGKKYLPEKPVFYKTKSKVAQEAHEAIRPTDVRQIPNSKFQIPNRNEEKLYGLIWQRMVACQMVPARTLQTKIELQDKDYIFLLQGARVLFDGFTRVYPIRLEENILPVLKQGDKLVVISYGITGHETQPPPRYNEASLIATLEKEGIGRPSTYAPIISAIQDRRYVEKKEGKFFATNLGMPVNDFLVLHFSDIVDLPFTAGMEEGLDKIAKGEEKEDIFLSNFWGSFSEKLEKVEENAKRVEIPVEKTDEKCPKCGGNLVVRIGRFGKFLACEKFPKCDFTKNYVEKVEGPKCPKCGGEIVIRRTKRGKQFYGCSNYPNCEFATWKKKEIVGKT